MIDFSKINFTTEESAEIADLETATPDQAFYLKMHLALEKLQFIVPVGVSEMEGRLINEKHENIESLISDWDREEYEGGTPNSSMTFVRFKHPEYPNVTIHFRKQSEAATNKFYLRIKE